MYKTITTNEAKRLWAKVGSNREKSNVAILIMEKLRAPIIFLPTVQKLVETIQFTFTSSHGIL